MNLIDAIEMYAQYTTSKSISNLKTTLKLYIFPGFSPGRSKKSNFENWLTTLSLKEFLSKAENTFENEYATALAHKNERTLKNNRSSLNQFMQWMKTQRWYAQIEPSLGILEIPSHAPVMGRLRPTLADLRRGRRKMNANPYALKPDEFTPALNEQFKQLRTYLTSPYMPARRGDPPIREVSWEAYYRQICAFLGWQKHIQQIPVESIDLTQMADQTILQEHLSWLFSERQTGYRTAQMTCCAALNVAKWHYGRHSKLARFMDCPEVLAIRSILNELAPMEKTDRRHTSPEALRERLLDFEQCQEVVQYLRRCCAERSICGKKRAPRAIIDSWQDYLLVAILTYTPVRQREIRELQIGHNLFRESDGWWVKLTADGHKTGSTTGKGREYPLFPGSFKAQLTHDLDTYINVIRPRAQLKHDFLFFMRGKHTNKSRRGEPITTQVTIRSIVPNLVHKVTCCLYGVENAKAPTPHDFRRIFVTWLHSYGTLEEQELYAEVLGHSVQEASRTYSMLKSRDKTERADDAFRAIAERAKRIKAQKQERELS